MRKINEYFLIIYDFLYSIYLCYKEYDNIVIAILSFMFSCIIPILSDNNQFIFRYLILFGLCLLVSLFIYYRLFKYVPIFCIERKYSMNLTNPPEIYFFQTGTLMLDHIFSTGLSFKVKLNQCFKKNIEKTKKKEGNYCYTLVIEKDKLVTAQLPSEYINEDFDVVCNERNIDYYYVVQEYKGQNDLEFNVNFSCTNNININKSITVYLEYGDIHENIIVKNLKNKVFGDEFFITDLSSLKR